MSTNHYYYLNANAQSGSNEHEIHVTGCGWMPIEKNKISLGSHANQQSALKKAKKDYPNWKINGCAYCCTEINTD